MTLTINPAAMAHQAGTTLRRAEPQAPAQAAAKPATDQVKLTPLKAAAKSTGTVALALAAGTGAGLGATLPLMHPVAWATGLLGGAAGSITGTVVAGKASTIGQAGKRGALYGAATAAAAGVVIMGASRMPGVYNPLTVKVISVGIMAATGALGGLVAARTKHAIQN